MTGILVSLFILYAVLGIGIIVLDRKVARLEKKITRLERRKPAGPPRKKRKPVAKGWIRKLERLF